jgi:hypothetical protein
MLRRFESARNHWATGAMVTVAVGIVMIAAVGVQLPAAAQVEGTGRTCSNVTLQGRLRSSRYWTARALGRRNGEVRRHGDDDVRR